MRAARCITCRPSTRWLVAEVLHVVCMQCGARWEREGHETPRECQTAGCEAGWLDLPCFRRLEDADRAAAKAGAAA